MGGQASQAVMVQRSRPRTLISRATDWLRSTRKKELEPIQDKALTPLQRVEAKCKNIKGDKATVLAGYLKELLKTHEISTAEALKLEPGETTDIIFQAAITVFSEDNGPIGKKAGIMAQAMINNVSEDSMTQSLSQFTDIMLNGRREGRLERTARMMATMCRRVANREEQVVTKVTDLMEHVGSAGVGAQQRAAQIFLEAMNSRVVPAKAVA